MTASSDSSTRFVLAEDAPYLKNMAVLWTVDPALAGMIEASDGEEAPAWCKQRVARQMRINRLDIRANIEQTAHSSDDSRQR